MYSRKSLPQQERRTRHVALCVDSYSSPRRQMISGVAQYIQEHEPWSLYLKPDGVSHALSDWLEHWDGDGIIAAVHAETWSAFENLRMPVVDIAGGVPGVDIPLVHANDRAIGRIAAEHLADRGFRHFAFCERPKMWWSTARREGFAEVARQHGNECHVFALELLPSAGGPFAWERQQQLVVEWIQKLPKPVGVMASTDLMGQQFLEACLRAGVKVPEEVAVIGADNDEPICRVCTPPMSSVVINDHARGFEAAKLLDQMMSGQKAPKDPIYIEPAGITCRASTDILAIDDQAVVSALRYIRQNATQGINVVDVTRKVPVSRRVLERRFRKLVGRSMHQEIMRMRLNLAVELLTGTNLELKVIAHRTGFGSQAYMTAVFRAELGRTPGSYRVPTKNLPTLNVV